MTGVNFRATGEDTQRVLIIGKTGSSKTTLAVRFAESARRCDWIDVKGTNDARPLGALPCRRCQPVV